MGCHASTRTAPIACALATCLALHATHAAASYAQMTLPGLGAMLLLALLGLYALVVDAVLLAKGFRLRALLVANVLIVLAWLVALWVDRGSVAALFEGLGWEWQASLLAAMMLVVPATLVMAPVLQHVELRQAATRRAAWGAIALQGLFVAAWLTYDHFQDHPLAATVAERNALRAKGEAVPPGGLTTLADDFEKRHAWGTWESLQLLKGVDASPLIHGGAALGPDDRNALRRMLDSERAHTRKRLAAIHYYPSIDAKLLWDSLEPGRVERSIPRGAVLPHTPLLEYLDRYGTERLCADGRFAPADRQALRRALTASRGPEDVALVDASLQRIDDGCR
jgi:hypothetical protein